MTTTNGKHRKTLSEHLDALNAEQHAEEAEALKTIRQRYSGKRAAKILGAPYQQLLDAGITDAAAHPDVKAALASRAPEKAAAAESKPEPKRAQS